MKKSDKKREPQQTPVEPEPKEAAAPEAEAPSEAEAASRPEETAQASQAEAQPEAEVERFDEDAWKSALETAVAQRDEYLDSLRRVQADFQNFKRRNATSRSDGYQDGVCAVVEAVLPVLDNLERALGAANSDDPLASGVQMTLKLLHDNLKPFGFEEVPALGEEFDPEKHNAVMREAGEEPGKVLEVFQKGYRVKDKIVRYAMVKVAVEA